MWESRWTALCERDGGDSDAGERDIKRAQGETSWHMETTQAVNLKTLLTVAFGPHARLCLGRSSVDWARAHSLSPVDATRLAGLVTQFRLCGRGYLELARRLRTCSENDVLVTRWG